MPARTIFFLGLGVALGPTLLRLYLLSPFPGSQDFESIRWVCELSRFKPLTEIAGALIAAVGLWAIQRRSRDRKTAAWVAAAVLVTIAAYGMTLRYAAPAIFKPNLEPTFARGVSEELPPETLVMGLRSGPEAKAYPLRLLAYHHQVWDEIAGEPIWVTYCSMCRTGKIFRPVVACEPLSFDLVGAVRYNSIYRDSGTGSFWYQANGRAVAGPLTGTTLSELRSDQMTLGQWLELHPDSDILQPDPDFAEGYRLFGFDSFDERRSDSEDPPGWQWVVGVVHGEVARAYPWSLLAGEFLIQDRIGDLPLAIHLRADGVSHRVWDRRLDGHLLELRLDQESDRLVDEATGSSFGFDGMAVDGELAGQSLVPVPSTVEYRHSFEYFSGGEIFDPASADGPGGDF